jgi:Flp pilus assembly protein TadG
MSRFRLRGERGQAAVEFALCASAFFMIVFSLLKVATIYGDYVALQHAARDGSRAGSVTRGTGNAVQASVASAVTTAVLNDDGVLSASQMGISVTGLDSHDSPNGTLWEAHDRLQVTVTYPYKFELLGVTIVSGTMSSTTEALIE